MFNIRNLPVLASIALFAGCTSLAAVSTPFTADNVPRQGIPYALPKPMITIGLEMKKGVLTVTGPQVVNVPDLEHRYWLERIPDTASEDKVIFAVDTNGLLSSINSVNEDRAPEIAKQIVTLAVDVATGTPGSLREAGGQGSGESFKRELLFDPYDPRDVQRANREIRRLLKAGRIAVDIVGDHVQARGAVDPFVETVLPDEGAASVYFRTLRPIIVTTDLDNLNYSSRTILVAADPHSRASLRIDRASCVKKETKLTFAAGVPTKFEVTHPSEVEGCLSIPADIINAILGFPIARLESEKALAKAEEDLLKQQLALAQAQAALIAATASAKD